jgi:hypothetical protein
MKPNPFLFLPLALFALALPARAGQAHLSFRGSLYKPYNSDSYVFLVGVSLRYDINRYWTADGNVEYASYTDRDGRRNVFLPVTADLIGHPFGRRTFDPYLGGGLGYYYRTIADTNRSSVGFQTVTGIRLSTQKGFGIAFEVRYIAPDISKPKEGGFSYSGDIGGGMTISF